MSHAFLGDYPVNTKVNKFNSVDRCFDKNNSVWKHWKEDKDSAVITGFLEEVANWKVPNFVKDPEDQ